MILMVHHTKQHVRTKASAQINFTVLLAGCTTLGSDVLEWTASVQNRM